MKRTRTSLVTRSFPLGIIIASVLVAPAAVALQIDIIAGAGLGGSALDAFERAAAQWEVRIADPILVTINADLLDLGANNLLGQASSTLLIGDYVLLRNALIDDAALEADDAIVASLPTAAAFNPTLPTGIVKGDGIIGTKANLKALGFADLDTTFGVSDGIIEFNSNFTFDFDRIDGIVGIDFETVAAHEIGHTLGFISMVDFVDQIIGGIVVNPGEVSPTTLDLFRFSAAPPPPIVNPSNPSEFATLPREMRSDEDAIFDDTAVEFAMSTGAFTGDGRQASHFKDDSITGVHIGIMEPTLAAGVAFDVSEADFRALDVIGYDIVTAPVPLPAPLLLLLSGVAGLAAVGRRRVS